MKSTARFPRAIWVVVCCLPVLLIIGGYLVWRDASRVEMERHDCISPDGRWGVLWESRDTGAPDSCTVTFFRKRDGKIFFTHKTVERYVTAAWNKQSTKCLLLDAPDNANSYLWVFRISGDDAVIEELDYDGLISNCIEDKLPEMRNENAHPHLTRSGIEKIIWDAESKLRLEIVYNNVAVVAHIDLTKKGEPKVRVERGRFEF